MPYSKYVLIRSKRNLCHFQNGRALSRTVHVRRLVAGDVAEMLLHHQEQRAQRAPGPLDSVLLPALLMRERFGQQPAQPRRRSGRGGADAAVQRRGRQDEGALRRTLGDIGAEMGREDELAEPRRVSYESAFMRNARTRPCDELPGFASNGGTMAALVRDSRARSEALRGTPSRSAARAGGGRRGLSAGRARTPDDYDSDIWHALPADVRDGFMDEAESSSGFIDEAERMISRDDSSAPAPRPSGRASPVSVSMPRWLGSMQVERPQQRHASPTRLAPLDAAKEFHDSISRLERLERKQAKQARAEASEYSKRGGGGGGKPGPGSVNISKVGAGSNDRKSPPKRLSYDAQRLLRAESIHHVSFY